MLPQRGKSLGTGWLVRDRGHDARTSAAPAHLGFDEYDTATQGLLSHHYWTENEKVEAYSVPFRYVWPSELDPMARLAEMNLRERWSNWNRESFTSASQSHISVRRKK